MGAEIETGKDILMAGIFNPANRFHPIKKIETGVDIPITMSVADPVAGTSAGLLPVINGRSYQSVL